MSQTIRITVDVTNPGQFFACCGLLELSARLWPETTGAFAQGEFFIEPLGADATLPRLLSALKDADPSDDNPADAIDDGPNADDEGQNNDEDMLASPLSLGTPFNLVLNWWTDKAIKPWAGSMNARLIFKTMRKAIIYENADPFNDLRVIYDQPEAILPGKRPKKPKKREPFYFDSRRGGNAKSLDVGFAPDAFKMTSATCPAVEALCMVGLQRFRPMPTDQPRVFVYRAWTIPLSPSAAAAAASGLLPRVGGNLYRFENAFRTDQRKHKGFLPATRIVEGDTP